MRKMIFLVAALSLLAVPTAPALAELDTPERTAICPSVESLARTIMKGRQMGHPMSSLMEIANNNSEPAIAELMRKLIVLAYAKPRYSTEEFQEREIANFANDVSVKCYTK